MNVKIMENLVPTENGGVREEMEAGSTQIRTEKCFQHFVWKVNSEKLQAEQTEQAGLLQSETGSFRAKYLGLRCAQETELQTVTSSANSNCKSKSNLHVCTVWKGLELKDWFLLLHLHTQTGITDRNITFEGPGKFYVFIYLHLFT